MSSEPTQERRRALRRIFGGAVALAAAPVAWVVGRFVTPPPHRSDSVVAGSERELGDGAWHFVRMGGSDVMVRRTSQDWIALDLLCTHAACTVRWEGSDETFHCPCHNGRFDAEGRVLSGPPPRPLERLDVELAGDRVILRRRASSG